MELAVLSEDLAAYGWAMIVSVHVAARFCSVVLREHAARGMTGWLLEPDSHNMQQQEKLRTYGTAKSNDDQHAEPLSVELAVPHVSTARFTDKGHSRA